MLFHPLSVIMHHQMPLNPRHHGLYRISADSLGVPVSFHLARLLHVVVLPTRGCCEVVALDLMASKTLALFFSFWRLESSMFR